MMKLLIIVGLLVISYPAY
ncbi:type I toxin-antitoxin system Ibs family toxin [Escherichia coli]|nr:type I toxin-antitoxin system Ibs family toxin [Escherichia coli]EEQ6101966.1 type I toxin-antitoxin system Ibs family toxin [Escherichia coli]EES3893426.1 type I toxin-antitoxin system Ibs family toxin [Escherichia coli]EES4271073.1 type I toxin-antitoxin system Ibs family toxin [Escherichia coli]EET0445403.1 type I toxin-antitoxin system Ibs family toxin [Escherichia coli]EEU2539366.1 type I toxin-antitoxin system Ibs family toxin [Escherichia coli]